MNPNKTTIDWNLNRYADVLEGYTELRAQENRNLSISMLNGQMLQNASRSESGISARSFHKGAWGFSSLPDVSPEAIKRVAQQAQKNAKFLGQNVSLSPEVSDLERVQPASGSQDERSQKSKMSASELNQRLAEFDGLLKEKFPQISNRSLTVMQQDFIKEGLNSERAHTKMHYARSYLVMGLGMNSENGPVELRHVMGDRGQLEDTFPTREEFLKEAEELVRHLSNKAKGVKPTAGRHTVVLASKLAGILAHEAIGHTTEADIVKGGSVAREMLGQKAASPLVSLVDFAHTALGKTCPSPVYFDDEGTPAQDTVIIKDGILVGFMHSKQTAHEFSAKATGHARAWAFNDEPLIRMRNTAILPGTHSVEEMIASVEDGYFLMDHSNGQADSTSEFMFGVTMGYEIKNGKLGRALLDTTVSGVAFDMLKTVSMISRDFSWVSYGTCGKKQPMFVGMGGPAIKCEITLGGQ